MPILRVTRRRLFAFISGLTALCSVRADTSRTVRGKPTSAPAGIPADPQVAPVAATDSFTQAAIGSALWPQTQPERSAGVTPVSLAYPDVGQNGFDSRRYGLDPTGASNSDAGWASMMRVARNITSTYGSPFWFDLNNGLYKFANQITIDENVGVNLRGSILYYAGTAISSDDHRGAFVYFTGTDHSFGGMTNGFVDANTLAAFCVYAVGNFNTNFDVTTGMH